MGSNPTGTTCKLKVRYNMIYPGDTATPKEVASFFASVAEEYELPRILPVMTSCVELTAAWTGPGDVKDITGYLTPVDHWSVGYFQQQYDGNPDGIFFGWGKYDQLINADYAVRRFCQEAVKFKDWEWHENTTDPDALGRWCQAVQRSAFPDAYRDKGYPMALALLEDEVKEYPERTISFNDNGWAYDLATKEWIKVKPDPNIESIEYDSNGWLYANKKETSFWPEASDAPIPSSWNYELRHPTRYTWRADIEEWARYLVENYDVWCNTYYDHPEGYWRTYDSIDVWGKGGRNYAIDPEIGDEVFKLLFYYEGKPDIDWIIWQGWIWTRTGGWAKFGYDDFTWHYDHIHVTYI